MSFKAFSKRLEESGAVYAQIKLERGEKKGGRWVQSFTLDTSSTTEPAVDVGRLDL